MVKHIILWKLKQNLSNPIQTKLEIKESLESLVGKIPGLIDAKVITNNLDTSTVDCMLISTLESKKVLENYAIHPLHVDIVNNIVKPVVDTRIAFDYETTN